MSDQPANAFDLCSVDELKERTAISFEFLHPRFGRHEIAVVWDGQDVYAIENYCPHEGALLSYGLIEPGEVICPLHSAVFDLKTGECLDKYTYNTMAYEAEVHDGRVWVKAPGERRPDLSKPEAAMWSTHNESSSGT